MHGYLSRYTHRVAIANRRLIASDEDSVTFRYKAYRTAECPRYADLTIEVSRNDRRGEIIGAWVRIDTLATMEEEEVPPSPICHLS
jgi:hypothetical protein